MSARYPVLLDVGGRPCLVVGGGPVAARKVDGLVDAGADVTVCAPTVVSQLAEAAAGGRVRWRQERVTSLPEPPADEPWAFVVAATDDATRNRALAAEARRAQVWATDVSAPDGGAAASPAVWRDGPVCITASTGGVHPEAAAWLRDRAAAAIGPEPAIALQLVSEATSGGAGPRPSWQGVRSSGMLEAIRAGQLAEAKERLEACLSSSSD